MREQKEHSITSQDIIDAVNRCLPLFNDEDIKEKLLRVYYLLLMLRTSTSYFQLVMWTLPFTERWLKECHCSEGSVNGLSDLVNMPFTFEYLSSEDALIVEKFLLKFFTEDNSLQKYLMVKFHLSLLRHEDSMMNAVRILLLQDKLKERFTFEYREGISEKCLLGEINQYFTNKGFVQETCAENSNSVSMTNSSKNEKVFVTVSCHDGIAIFCSVNTMSC